MLTFRGKACRAIAVEFHMDEAISASELAKKVNVLEGVCIHWTGLLDWTTGLDYWTDL